MKTPPDYLALAIILLPVSAVLACLICHGCPRLKRWFDRTWTHRLGNHYRDESWHRTQSGPSLQLRTRR